MYAGIKKPNNLCVILDNNKYQNEVSVIDTLGDNRFKDKLNSLDGISFLLMGTIRGNFKCSQYF